MGPISPVGSHLPLVSVGRIGFSSFQLNTTSLKKSSTASLLLLFRFVFPAAEAPYRGVSGSNMCSDHNTPLQTEPSPACTAQVHLMSSAVPLPSTSPHFSSVTFSSPFTSSCCRVHLPSHTRSVRLLCYNCWYWNFNTFPYRNVLLKSSYLLL